MTKPNELSESSMLERVRDWRRAAYEARQQTRDPREQARQTDELLRTFGLTPPTDKRKPAA